MNDSKPFNSLALTLMIVILSMGRVAARIPPLAPSRLRLKGGGHSKDELMEAASALHSSTCSETSYWTGSSSAEAPGIAFHECGSPTSTLPDFSGEFSKSAMVFVSKKPVFSREECRHVIDSAERHFARSGGWTKLPSGRFEVSGGWIKDIPEVLSWFNTQLQERLFPTIANIFPGFIEDVSNLCVESCYLFKYTPETGGKTDIHIDSGCLSFTIALNDASEYDGGGTWYESIDGPAATNGVVTMDAGHVTFRPGGVRHQGKAVTRGERYIIGGFMMHKKKVEFVRMLLRKGLQLAHDGRFSEAEVALKCAVDLNPQFDGTLVTLADVLKKQGKDAEAASTLERVWKLNPQNSEASYSLGLIRMEAGDKPAAQEFFLAALDADPTDTDAMSRCAELCASEGRFKKEAEWHRRVLVSPGLPTETAASAYCNLGVALGEVGNGEEELAMYEKALDLDPHMFQAMFSMGSYLANHGSLDRAVATFRTLVDLPAIDHEQKMRALKLLYKAAVMVFRSNPGSSPIPPDQVPAKLKELMGGENFDILSRKKTCVGPDATQKRSQGTADHEEVETF
jgi:tetratricopeptide (TPR) repeat protein